MDLGITKNEHTRLPNYHPVFMEVALFVFLDKGLCGDLGIACWELDGIWRKCLEHNWVVEVCCSVNEQLWKPE